MAGNDLKKGRTVKLRLPEVRFERRTVRTGDDGEEGKPEGRALDMTVRVRGPQRSEIPETGQTEDRREPPGVRTLTHEEAAEILRQRRKRRSAAVPVGEDGGTGFRERIVKLLRRDGERKRVPGKFDRKAAAGTAVFLAAALLVSVIAGLTMSVSGSPFGILLSAEDSGSGNMRELIAEITEEYRVRIAAVESSVPHDRVEYSSGGPYAVKWNEILSVYAVMVSENGDTVSVDGTKKETLRRLFEDMNRTAWTTRTEEGKEDGEEITVLVFSCLSRDTYVTAERLSFTEGQMSSLRELLSGRYDRQFARIIGSWREGGQILIPDGGRRPLGIIGWPLADSCTLTSYFGYRDDPFTGEQSFHGGIDLACPEGTPVIAAADGTVTYVNAADPWGYGYGYHVIVEHEKGLSTLYGHCSAVSVTSGQTVKAGEVIAYVGSTGNSTGDHLHFEVRRNGEREDPLLWFA